MANASSPTAQDPQTATQPAVSPFEGFAHPDELAPADYSGIAAMEAAGKVQPLHVGFGSSEFKLIVVLAVVGLASSTVLCALDKITATAWLDFVKWLFGILGSGYALSRGLSKMGTAN